MQARESFQVTIPSDIAEGQAIQERILRMLVQRDFTTRDVFGVRLALEEAIVNAIKHGNKFAADKSVQIRWELDDDGIKILIEDEGAGFNPSDIPDPTLEENLERPSGRGIMLIRAYMNFCEYQNNGRRVVMEKQRTIE